MNRIFILVVIVLFFSSCEKEPGEGGTSSIIGSVYKISTYFNVLTQEVDTVFYQLDSGEDVYVIYSDNESDFYNDKIETNWNGQYRFDYLRKGDYTIFVYADSTDILNISYDYPVFQHISVEANNSTYTLSDFIINK
jgi:hypothetical protein|tara:strand:+ start:1267 stop:1677 length:411 start_codon:yes stop_codon:yes gene_type:complete